MCFTHWNVVNRLFDKTLYAACIAEYRIQISKTAKAVCSFLPTEQEMSRAASQPEHESCTEHETGSELM